MVGAIDVFISYADADESLCRELEAHLSALQREGVIRAWSRRYAAAGEDRRKQITENRP